MSKNIFGLQLLHIVTVVMGIIMAVLYMKGRYSPVPANYYLIIISGAIALRSGMFLMFDSTAATAEDDE